MNKLFITLAFTCLFAFALASTPSPKPEVCRCYTGKDEGMAAQACSGTSGKSVLSCEITSNKSTGKTCCSISRTAREPARQEMKEEVVEKFSEKQALQTSSRAICRRLLCRYRCVCTIYRCYCYRYCYWYYYYC